MNISIKGTAKNAAPVPTNPPTIKPITVDSIHRPHAANLKELVLATV
jgi:hypothetical protein